jgi:hypothetical protein
MCQPKDYVLVNDMLLAVPCYQEDVPIVLEATINLDLSEFKLSSDELDKLQKIMQKLTVNLSNAFSKNCLAASITSDIRPKKSSQRPAKFTA